MGIVTQFSPTGQVRVTQGFAPEDDGYPKDFTGHYVDSGGMLLYWKDGKLHRDDGPAVIFPQTNYYSSNCRSWYQNGVRHRVGGPAVEYNDGRQLYYFRGKLHRLDGPAKCGSMLYPGGIRHDDYWVNGRRYESSAYPQAVANWLSYKEFTRDEITSLIGNFRIVEWE